MKCTFEKYWIKLFERVGGFKDVFDYKELVCGINER